MKTQTICGRRTILQQLSLIAAGGVCPIPGAQDAERSARSNLLTADSPQVLISFTAEDRSHHLVDGLTTEDLRLRVDDRDQRINFVSLEDGPASILFVVDVSSSMKKPVENIREAMRRMLRAAMPEDEFALVEFGNSAEVTVDWTVMPSRLEARLQKMEPAGRTPLSDAVLLGLRQIDRSHNARRAVVVVSDGRENFSRHVRSEAYRSAVETDARIYAIEMYPAVSEATTGPTMLEVLARASGGRYLPSVTRQHIPELIERIDVHRSYVLGFTPPAEHRDGKVHQVKLKLRRKPRAEPVTLFWKEQYKVPPSV